ncbi:MAG: VanZ family protein [Fuerstiella sp.]|nr:VanZ family protein [Fuerstiella sp.]
MTRPIRGRIPLILLPGVLVLICLVFPFPLAGRLWSELFDLAHAPVFCGLLLIFVKFFDPYRTGLSPAYDQSSRFAGGQMMVISGGCVLLGCAGEYLQSFVGRSPSVRDLVSNAAGVLAGVLWMCSRKTTGGREKLFVTASFMVLVLATLKPALGIWGAVIQQRDFPLLASFERRVDLGAWTEQQAVIRRTSEWASHGKHSLRLDFCPGRFSGIRLMWPVMDWRGYDRFACDIHNTASVSINLTLKIHDRAHVDQAGESADCYEIQFTVPPTTVRSLCVKLVDVADAPESRSMNLDQIASVELFTAGLTAGHGVLVDNMRLLIDESFPVDGEPMSDVSQH